MKKTVLMFMALLMTLGLKAQVKPIVLGAGVGRDCGYCRA